MKTVPRPLLMLHSDRAFQVRIRDAARNEFAIHTATSWAGLGMMLREGPPFALALVDPYTGPGKQAELCPELRRLLGEFPSAAVIAAMEVQARPYADIRTLGEWGVAEVMAMEEDAVGATRILLRSVREQPLQKLLASAIPDTLPGRARVTLDAAAAAVAAGEQAAAMARHLHVSMRTLNRECGREGLPPPRQLLAWMRMLLAADLLDNAGCSIEVVAATCGYASDSGLRRVFQDFLDTNPTALRQGGAFAAVAQRFRAALSEAAGQEACPTAPRRAAMR